MQPGHSSVWQDQYFDRLFATRRNSRKIRHIQNDRWTRWPQFQTYNWVWPLDSAEAGGDARPTDSDR